MNPIQKLVEEHRNILAALESFDRFAAVTISSDHCDLNKLGSYVHFIQEYADKYHHSKEEDILFETMEQNGFSRQAGPLAVMLHEHKQGREYIKFLKEASLEGRELSADERQAVANAIRGYTELLRTHIYKEDNILYPMAQQRLSGDVIQTMTKQFEAVEATRAVDGEIVRLEALGRELAGSR